MNNPLMAAVNPFVFGQFQLYEGRTSYTISSGIRAELFRDCLRILKVPAMVSIFWNLQIIIQGKMQTAWII